MKLNELTIQEAKKKLLNKEITSFELTKACLEQIEKYNKELNICLSVNKEDALEKAKLADKRIEKGENSPLLGIPYLAKDNLTTKGIKTTASSKFLEDYIAPYNATVIQKLEDAGAILLGKTNLDEFAHGSSTENSAYGPTLNPWDKTRTPGGSSGGSAAAVSANFCIFALGSDTGGSIRQPASFCSVVGLKPSYGRVSRHGLISMTSSTDVVGPITKNVEDSGLIFSIISGKDKYDLTSYNKKEDESNRLKKLKRDENNRLSLKGLCIGLAEDQLIDLNKEVKEVILNTKKVLEKAGAKFINISLEKSKYAVPVYYIITPAEVSSNLARFDGLRFGFSEEKAKDLKDYYLKTRGKGFGKEAKRRIILGTYVLSAGYFDAYYLKAQKVREEIEKEFEEAFKICDLILSPSTLSTAFKFGEKASPLDMYLEDKFLAGPSLAGLPAISVPAGFIDKLPIGIQLIGDKSREDIVLAVAKELEERIDKEEKLSL